jgi:hypothetical protein
VHACWRAVLCKLPRQLHMGGLIAWLPGLLRCSHNKTSTSTRAPTNLNGRVEKQVKKNNPSLPIANARQHQGPPAPEGAGAWSLGRIQGAVRGAAHGALQQVDGCGERVVQPAGICMLRQRRLIVGH